MTGEELRSIREEHGLTQRAIGDLLGYHANYISRLETGKEKITQRFDKLVRYVLRKKNTKKSL